jgi:protein-disulfide isomerase
MKAHRAIPLLLGLALLAGAPAGCGGGGSDTDREILQELAALRDDVDEIKEGLEEIKSRPAAPTTAPAARPPIPKTTSTPVQTAGYPFRGRKDAPVTIVEFSDYQCPFCRRHNAQTLPQILRDYVDTDKVRYVFVDNPIPSHRYAAKAAEAAHCAGDQGKYWDMHDHLFQNQSRIRPENFATLAQEVGLDTAAFTQCLDGGKHRAEVDAGRRLAAAAGARGTPSFVVGRTRSDGSVTGDLIVGAKAYPVFSERFAKFLNN